MKWQNAQTINDIRKFVRENKNHLITGAWKQMLEDMDEYGEEYTMIDFEEEATIQMHNNVYD